MTNLVNTARIVRPASAAGVVEVCMHEVTLGREYLCPKCPTASFPDEPTAERTPYYRPKYSADVTLRCSECERPVRVLVESQNVLKIQSVHCGCPPMPFRKIAEAEERNAQEPSVLKSSELHAKGCYFENTLPQPVEFVGTITSEPKPSVCTDPNCQAAHPHTHPTAEEKYFGQRTSGE